MTLHSTRLRSITPLMCYQQMFSLTRCSAVWRMNPQYSVMVLGRCTREDSEAELSRTQNTFKALLRIKVERNKIFPDYSTLSKENIGWAHICLMQIELQTASIVIQNNTPQNLIKFSFVFLADKISIRLSDTRSSKVTSNPKCWIKRSKCSLWTSKTVSGCYG